MSEFHWKVADDFRILNGAQPRGLALQLGALRRLVEAGVSCHPAVMASFSSYGLLKRYEREYNGQL